MRWPLFPLDLLGWLLSGAKLYDWGEDATGRPIPVYALRWWWRGSTTQVALGRRILVRASHEASRGTLVHEQTHVVQQQDWGAVRYLALYAGEALVRFFNWRDRDTFLRWAEAWRRVSFEQDAMQAAAAYHDALRGAHWAFLERRIDGFVPMEVEPEAQGFFRGG